MSMLSYILADLFHILKIVCLCDMLIKFKRREIIHKNIINIVVLLLMMIMSVVTYLCKDTFVVVLLYQVAVVMMLFILFKEKLRRIIAFNLWIIVILAMLDLMSMTLIDTFMGFIGIGNESILKIAFAMLSLIIVYLFGCIYSNKYDDGIKNVGKINLLAFTLLSIVDAFIVMIMAQMTIDEERNVYGWLYSIALIMVVLGIFIQLGAVILLFMQRNVYKEKKQITEKYLDEQIGHYEYLEKRETETKKFRHDLKNHMQVISDLAHNGEYEKIDEYLDAMNMKIENFGNLVTVQHGIVDSIINKYYSLAVQNGITMNIKGIFPRDCSVEPYDLCTIFSNVLSNALEAAVEAEEKVINLECRYNEKNIIIVVSNTYKDVGQFEGERIKTRKDDIDYHGYGLTNIRESIHKHNGVLDIETKNGVFTISIMLNYVETRKYEDSGNR